MLKRILSRMLSSADSTVVNAPRKAAMENLESRVLLHNPTIQRAVADNRGEVQLTFDADSAEIAPSAFNSQSVQMYTNGLDGHANTGDDVRVVLGIKFTQGNQRLLLRGKNLAAGTGYRVRIVSSRIPVSPGFALDGEFSGAFPTGNGVAGGNFNMQVKNDKTSTPLVRMYSSEGLITLRMRKDLAPNTVRNFLTYTDSMRYDNVFFTRSENNPSPFVIQGGSLQITGSGTSASDVVATAKEPGIAEEFNVTNARGTVAMAKSGVGNSSATNQFFFNMADNGFLDAQQFTVFANLYGASSLAVADAINAKPVADLSSQIGNDPSTGVSNVPVQNEALAEASLNPFRDLMHMRRTVLMSKIAAV